MENPKHEFSTQKRARSTKLSQLTKLYNQIESEMISHANVDNVKSLYGKLKDKFQEFQSTHLKCLDMCGESDLIVSLEESYESSLVNFNEFNERYQQWFSKTTDTAADDEVNTSVSQVSSASSHAKLLSARAKRLVAENRLRQLKVSQELERAKRELELKQQLLKQQCELEEARLEEDVWRQDGVDVTDAVDLNDVTGTSAERKQQAAAGCERQADSHVTVTDSSRKIAAGSDQRSRGDMVPELRATTHPREARNTPVTSSMNCAAALGKSSVTYQNPEASASSIDAAFQRLANTLHEGFNLPKPELLTFDGTATEYPKFIRNFETNIESRICDDRLKLSYLIQYCKNEARSCIEDCVLLEPSEGYKRARSLLFSRYGRPHVIARSYVDKLVHGSPIKASDTDSLLTLALDMQKCEITLSQLGFASDIDNTENLRRMVKRLPMFLRAKWVDVAQSIAETGREPRFTDLAKFVDDKSRVATSVYGLDLARENVKMNYKVHDARQVPTKYKEKVTTLTVNSDVKKRTYSQKCCCCAGRCVSLDICPKFTSLSIDDRMNIVTKFRLCFNCLKGKHFSSQCRRERSCTVSECTQKHHILLHSWVRPQLDPAATQQSVNCAFTKFPTVKNCLGIIPVTVKGENGRSCETYALLDDGADKTLCDERLLRNLDVETRTVTFKISTVSSAKTETHGKEADLEVRPVDGSESISMRNVWSVKRLPISHRSAVTVSDLQKIPYLADVDIPQVDVRDVMLLIGTDNPSAHIPLEVRSGNNKQPYAIRTRLGWAVRGPISGSRASEGVHVHFEQTSDALLHRQLERMWTSDFEDLIHDDARTMSVEDRRALNMMENSVTHEDDHYKLGLPWRKENPSLPNNIGLAQARLQQLKRKLSSDPELHKKYTETVSDYIQKGYAEELTDFNSDRVWYLPHHPVTNVNKPGKVRVVFDCAAKYQGISLNSELLSGPDLMNNLVGVLIRFRQEKVAVAADIEAMFHQVRVKEEDCNALRFLWWPDGDLSQRPRHYCMRVHLFGATSSPSCAAFALKKTASDNAEKFDPEVVATVNRNFYVDDCLKSVPSEEQAIDLASDLRDLLKMGGFRLTKWISNKRNVISSIPESERAPSLVNLNPSDLLPHERALGVWWDVNTDTITFQVKIADKPYTRRGILSVVSSIFDPLGIVSPVTLQAKAIVQNLCRQKLGWDEQIPEKDKIEWMQWTTNLPCLENVAVGRCFQPEGCDKSKNAELHVFSDGSEVGYGACAYLRLIDKNGKVTCSLVHGKARLAPIKNMTIPRLELSGAVIACRIFKMLQAELHIKIDQTTFWTDSTIVLGYIKNETKRFKTFVGNRISIIQDLTSPEQWRYVDSASNPADIASRGISASDTKGLNTWLNGPQFLYHESEYWPQHQQVHRIQDDDVEVKREAVVHASTSSSVDNLLCHFSDWTALVRAICWFLRFKTYCIRQFLHNDIHCQKYGLTLGEVQEATHSIIAHVQHSCFADEIKALMNGATIHRSSRLLCLNPVLVGGLVRAKGRHSYSDKQDTLQIILPDKHHVTTLIVRHLHETNGHVGVQQVLATSREKYWILKCSSTVKKVLKSCLTCKRQREPLCSQLMAPLMKEQTTADMPPFSYVGIDFFGPLMVKTGRTSAKRYGCLFTCLTTRAVHIEVTHSLTTDSFLCAFRRFTSRRGVPKKVYSDNGTNLVSGDRELRKSIQDWNQSKIGRHMLQNEIEWHFNIPYASHKGGAWERLIHSVRSILKALVKQQLLTDEQVLTLMTEAERILNDRPITNVSSDPNDPSALTPNSLLLMNDSQCVPPGLFTKEDMYAKRRWRQVQYLADVFWRRWIREYLPTLQTRSKWQRPKRDIRKDDIVLVADDKAPRGQWNIGRVVNVNVSGDGHIRSCEIRTRSGNIMRPITKLCLLEGSD